MTYNLGKADRIFRVLIGFIIIEVGVYFEAWWGPEQWY
ncbi:MAG TPA: YgaP-like transmembrane domain [Thermodesulfobacteriota bacterium]|nr:YgaP-like transmembrane domain [Thermodesulfobacteriota bacterium]